MTTKEKLQRLIKVLKVRFPNLTAEEALNLAWDLLEAIAGPVN